MTARTQIAIWFGVAAFFVLVLVLLSDVLLPFVLGMAVAYALDPAADRLERWGLSRTLATSVITAAFVIGVALAAVFLVPLLQKQLIELLRRLPEYVVTLRSAVVPVVEAWLAELEPAAVERAEEVIANFSQRSVNFVVNLLADVWRSGLALLNFVGLVFITPVVTFYLLRDWDRLVERIDGWLPRAHAPVIREQAFLVHQALASFVRGQGLVCLILAAFYGLALTAVGLDFGLIVGIVAGLVSFIPYVGSIGGIALGAGLAYLQFSEFLPVALVVGIFVAGQIADDLFLKPKLLGHRLRLHPVWVIFAILAGGSLFGFVGVLLSVPVAAVAGVLLRFFLSRYLGSPLFHGGTTQSRESRSEGSKEP